MVEYRKKPVVIEAFKWTGGQDQTEDPEWIVEAIESGTVEIISENGSLSMFIYTLEGTMRADAGDYVIKGVKGELYPCKPDIFEQTYEEVSD